MAQAGLHSQAGSGGVGPTILETSLLLAGEAATAYVNNQKARVLCCASCMWARRMSRFCTTVFLRVVFHAETYSSHRTFGTMFIVWVGLCRKIFVEARP